jgi:hypothetical protein
MAEKTDDESIPISFLGKTDNDANIRMSGFSAECKDKDKQWIKFADFSMDLLRHGKIGKITIYLFDCISMSNNGFLEDFVLPLMRSDLDSADALYKKMLEFKRNLGCCVFKDVLARGAVHTHLHQLIDAYDLGPTREVLIIKNVGYIESTRLGGTVYVVGKFLKRYGHLGF